MKSLLLHEQALRRPVLQKRLGVSASTFAHAVASLSPEHGILEMGSRKTRRYTSLRPFSYGSPPWPLFAINEQGSPESLSTLSPVGPHGFLLTPPAGSSHKEEYFPFAPHFICDLIPQEFEESRIPVSTLLGRL